MKKAALRWICWASKPQALGLFTLTFAVVCLLVVPYLTLSARLRHSVRHPSTGNMVSLTPPSVGGRRLVTFNDSSILANWSQRGSKCIKKLEWNVFSKFSKENVVCQTPMSGTAFPSPDFTDTWHSLGEEETAVYSAYLDPKYTETVVVRVFGLIYQRRSRDYLTRPLHCQAWGEEDHSGTPTRSVSTKAAIEYLWRKKFRTRDVCFYCQFHPRQLGGIKPRFISITSSHCDRPTFTLQVHDVRERPWPYHRQFTVCLGGALRNHFSDYQHLVQWLEFNRLFGAEKFVVYNHSASATLNPYLEYYVDRGVMEIIDWTLPREMSGEGDTWTVAQLTLLNDCLMRQTMISKYVAFLDLDELLVPRVAGARTWSQLFEAVNCTHKPFILARNVFFHTLWPEDKDYAQYQQAKALGLSFLLQDKREEKLWPYKFRSKYIVRPEWQRRLQVHHAFLFHELSREGLCVLPPEDGALHHYRVWPDLVRDGREGEVESGRRSRGVWADTAGREMIGSSSYVIDKTLQRFGQEVMHRTEHVHKRVGRRT